MKNGQINRWDLRPRLPGLTNSAKISAVSIMLSHDRLIFLLSRVLSDHDLQVDNDILADLTLDETKN